MSLFSKLSDYMFTEDEIKRKRERIHKKMLKSGTTSDLKGIPDLRYLFELYDKNFFSGQIQRKLDQTKSKLDFIFSKHTKTGGTCSRRGCEWKINIPIRLFQGLFSKGEKNLLANGIWCTSQLDCLQIVFEHELMHLLMQLYEYQGRTPTYDQSSDTFTMHGKLYQCMAFLYFGHTAYKHDLLGGEVSDKIKKEEARIGMTVKFFSEKRNEEIHGRIIKLNPKTVIVQHSDGRSWKVPYTMLVKSDEELPPANEAPRLVKEFMVKAQFKPRMRVTYSFKGTDYYGTITRINPKRASIETDDGRNHLMPYHMLKQTDRPPPKVLSDFEKKNIKDEIRVGDMVRVKWKGGGIKTGKITKKNPSRAQILMDHDGKTWNVYYQNILGKVNGGPKKEVGPPKEHPKEFPPKRKECYSGKKLEIK